MVVSTDAVESAVCNLSSVLFRHGNFPIPPGSI
jgi:hypothetical protein